MKIRFLILTLFLSISFMSLGQTETFEEDIIRYLEINGTQDQYSQAYDEMFVVLRCQFSGSDVPESVWKELSVDKDESMREILQFLTTAYKNHFTRDEVNAMYTFYSSEAGKQLQKDPANLTPHQVEVVNEFMTGPMGQKIDSVRNGLVKDISDISEQWSRELFSAKMNLLQAKGY